MPIYEFECGACGERFEALVDAGTERAECPACGAAGAERRFSSFALHPAADGEPASAHGGRARDQSRWRARRASRRAWRAIAERSRGRERRDATAAAGDEEPAADPGVAGRRERLVEVYREASGCAQCPLAETRTKVVFGAGDADADLMFVGEAPGAEEDRQGLPFVGRAGELLNELLGRASA